MDIRQIDPQNRQDIDAFIVRRWYSLNMVAHGESIDLGIADGWYAAEKDEVIGLITWRITDGEMEILSLDSLRERRGIGTALLEKAINEAKQKNLSRVMLITTNDNLPALRFYQKRGFDLVCVHQNALEASRRIKPQIPLIGLDGIPLKHEIELEMQIKK